MRRTDREICNLAELETIIEKADVCHLALYDGDYPYLVTMNFGYKGGNHSCLYFHCAPKGKKIDIIKSNNKVCFSFDTDHELHLGNLACDFGMKYKSVVGFGEMHIVTDESGKLHGLDVIMGHYSNKESFEYDPKIFKATLVLRLDIEQMTGKSKN